MRHTLSHFTEHQFKAKLLSNAKMEQKLLQYIHWCFNRYNIPIQIDSLSTFERWLTTMNNQLVTSYPNIKTKENIEFFCIATTALEEAACMGYDDAVDMLLQYTSCTAAGMKELFTLKAYAMIHKIVERDKLWGDALAVFKMHEDEYHTWFSNVRCTHRYSRDPVL